MQSNSTDMFGDISKITIRNECGMVPQSTKQVVQITGGASDISVVNGTFALIGGVDHLKNQTVLTLVRSHIPETKKYQLIQDWGNSLQKMTRKSGKGFDIVYRQEENELGLVLKCPDTEFCSIAFADRLVGINYIKSAIVKKVCLAKRHSLYKYTHNLLRVIDFLDRYPFAIRYRLSDAMKAFLPETLTRLIDWKSLVFECCLKVQGREVHLSELGVTMAIPSGVLEHALLTDYAVIPMEDYAGGGNVSLVSSSFYLDSDMNFCWLMMRTGPPSGPIECLLMIDRGFLLDHVRNKYIDDSSSEME